MSGWVLLPQAQLGRNNREKTAARIQPQCALRVFHRGVELLAGQPVLGCEHRALLAVPPNQSILGDSPELIRRFRQQRAYFGSADRGIGGERFRTIPIVVDKVAVTETEPDSLLGVGGDRVGNLLQWRFLKNPEVLDAYQGWHVTQHPFVAIGIFGDPENDSQRCAVRSANRKKMSRIHDVKAAINSNPQTTRTVLEHRGDVPSRESIFRADCRQPVPLEKTETLGATNPHAPAMRGQDRADTVRY